MYSRESHLRSCQCLLKYGLVRKLKLCVVCEWVSAAMWPPPSFIHHNCTENSGKSNTTNRGYHTLSRARKCFNTLTTREVDGLIVWVGQRRRRPRLVRATSKATRALGHSVSLLFKQSSLSSNKQTLLFTHPERENCWGYQMLMPLMVGVCVWGCFCTWLLLLLLLDLYDGVDVGWWSMATKRTFELRERTVVYSINRVSFLLLIDFNYVWVRAHARVCVCLRIP